MTELADAAFRQAAKHVIEKAIQTGTPVIIRENGTMKRFEPDKLPASVIKAIEVDDAP